LAVMLRAYERHFDEHRPHQALGQRAPKHAPGCAVPLGQTVRRRTILGGAIHEYDHAA